MAARLPALLLLVGALAGCGSGGVSRSPSLAPLAPSADCGAWKHASAEKQQTTARADLGDLRQAQQQPVASSTPDPPTVEQVTRLVPAITAACAARGDDTIVAAALLTITSADPSYLE